MTVKPIFNRLLSKIHESIGASDAAWSIEQLRTGPISSWVDRDLLRTIGSKLHGFDHLSGLMERAENGDIDAGDVPVNSDGDIPEWGFDSVHSSLDRQRDDKIGEIRECVRRFTSQIEVACTGISESLGKIINTAPAQ